MAKEPPIVEVEWEDAWSISDVTSMEEKLLHESIIRKSVGYLLATKPSILLCASPYLEFDKGQDFTSIPKKLVRKMQILKPEKDA